MNKKASAKPERVGGSQGAADDIPESRVRDALACELLGVCIAALGRYGIDRQRLAKIADEAIASAGEIPTASKISQDTDRLGELANEWTENPSYVDSSGRPRVLPIAGRGATFSSLVRKHFVDRSADQVVELGCRTRLLERVGQNKVAQFGGCVILTGHPLLMLAHAIHSVRWFLTTTLTNAGSQLSAIKALPDRRACTAVSPEDLQEFIDVMRQPIVTLVEMGNRWLEARAAMKRASKAHKKIRIGVHAYVFRDPEKVT